jgi:hypothetical protein
LGHDLFGKFLHFLAGDRSHFVAAFFRFRFQLGIVERAGKGAENFQPIESDTTSPLGPDAQIIGEVVSEHPGMVLMKTGIGGAWVVDVMFGEQLPRIC